ncbi:MAG: DUF4926 domain-containing protein [Chthonomonadaceae bacterium]|nr:DUF4926 domain-containing protein [Chthonomonadaceae bacterium]
MRQNASFHLLDTVALLEDVPEQSLLRGQVGAIVETLSPGVFEVEFVDTEGRTYAQCALHAQRLIRLIHAPLDIAA